MNATLQAQELADAIRDAEHYIRAWKEKEPGRAIIDSFDAILAAAKSLSDEQKRAQDAVTRGLKLAQALKEIAEYTGEGPRTTPWQAIVKDITDHARAALKEAEK